MANCLKCQRQLTGRQLRFCSKKCANDWHNANQVWSERPDREFHNARQQARYQADPEAAAARMRKWRAEHPELQKAIERRHRIKCAEKIKEQSAQWREQNRQNLRDRAISLYYETREKTPWKHILRSRYRDALKRGLPFTLTPEWAAERWTGRCEITDIPFNLTNFSPGFYSPSIDRIDPKLGYVPDNCRFILLAVNSFKNTATDQDMYEVAKLLISRLKLAPLEVKTPGTRHTFCCHYIVADNHHALLSDLPQRHQRIEPAEIKRRIL